MPECSPLSAVAKKNKPPKRGDPVSRAAHSMIELMEAPRDSEWLTLAQVVDRVPGLTWEVAQAAFLKAPAKSRIVWAIPSDPDSPLVLKENLSILAQNESLLKLLVQRGCTAETPVRTLSDLTNVLDKSLKKLVDQYWPQHTERIPAGLEPMSTSGDKKKKLFAIHDTRFPLPEVELSDKLVAALQSLKEAAQQSYPTGWSALLQACGDSEYPGDDLLRRAKLQIPFASRAREISIKGQVWIAFAEDIQPTICSESFLQRLVQETCQIEKPEVKLTQLSKLVPKELQQPFIDHWLGRVEHKLDLDFATLQPAGTSKKRDVLIRDRRFPLEEMVLAENFVKILASQKAIGGASYPTTWQRLVELTGTPAQVIRDKAIRTEYFQSHIVVSMPGDPNAPLALIGDEAVLGNSLGLLSTVLGKIRTSDNHLVAIDKIVSQKGLHPAVRPHFQTALEHIIDEKLPPAGIGALKAGKKWGLFLWQDVIGIGPGQVSSPDSTNSDNEGNHPEPATAVDPDMFARDFDAAFAALDGKLGLPHYASLVDLRPALKQYSREVFDQELLKLRRLGRYSLSLVEGRFGLSDDERAACLVVDHVSHLLVQKK